MVQIFPRIFRNGTWKTTFFGVSHTDARVHIVNIKGHDGFCGASIDEVVELDNSTVDELCKSCLLAASKRGLILKDGRRGDRR